MSQGSGASYPRFRYGSRFRNRVGFSEPSAALPRSAHYFSSLTKPAVREGSVCSSGGFGSFSFAWSRIRDASATPWSNAFGSSRTIYSTLRFMNRVTDKEPLCVFETRRANAEKTREVRTHRSSCSVLAESILPIRWSFVVEGAGLPRVFAPHRVAFRPIRVVVHQENVVVHRSSFSQADWSAPRARVARDDPTP